jgi:membrane dipeptidase
MSTLGQHAASTNVIVLLAVSALAAPLSISSATAQIGQAKAQPTPRARADTANKAGKDSKDGKERSEAEARRVAERVLTRAIIIDTHADTPQMMLDEGYDLANPASPFMISIPKMRAGHLGAEFMSIWVDVDWPPKDLIHRALDLIDVVDSQVARHPDALEAARTAADVVRIHRQGKLAILIGLEGGHIIEDDLRVLDIYHGLGVRYMTLTHTKNNALGDSSGDKPKWNGLSGFGRQVVERMNRLGMMVDISHVSDKTFHDAVAASKAPVIASHSSCRALCDAPRDMTDDMIRALAKNGGVMDINFYSAFVDQNFRDAYNKIAAPMDAEVKAAREQLQKEGKHLSYAEETKLRQKYQANLPLPSFERIADHVDHAVQVAGVDHVGLGSDFDGVDSIPRGMEDCSKLPNLVRELARRGYSEQDLEKILGGNVLRVMRQVEDVSRRMQSGK